MNSLLKYKLSFLILFLSLFSLGGLWYFFYSKKLPFLGNNTNVLGASKVSLNRITQYDIEFKDLDGQLKSIRPKSCLDFDIPGKPGFVDRMKLTCNRQYKIEFPNAYKNSPDTGWMNIIRGDATWGVNVPIKASVGSFNKVINIFPNSITSYTSALSPQVPKYRPILESFSGRPVMFYYGGIHEVNLSKNTTYLLTRFYDSEYYTRGPVNLGDVPRVTYKLNSNERFFFVSPVIHNTSEESCFTCSQSRIDSGGCPTAGSSSTLYCPGLAAEDNRTGAGKLSPELVRSSYVRGDWREDWSTGYAAWSFKGSRAEYANAAVRAKTRYQNWPFLDSVQLADCDGSTACNNPTSEGNLYVTGKYSSELAYTPGYGINYKLNCIGKNAKGSCAEVVMTGGRRDTVPNTVSYSSFRYIHSLVQDSSNCSSNTSANACFKQRELLFDGIWPPFSNLSTGFEVPELQYDLFNTKNCQLTGSTSGSTSCIKAIDWYNGSNITFYSDYIDIAKKIKDSARPANFPPSNIDFYFTNNTSYFAIKMNPTSSTMDIYRYWLNNQGNTESKKYTYNFSVGSPMPTYYRPDEISVAFNEKSSDIDILFSSMNAPSNYAPANLRVLRLVNGNLSVNSSDPIFTKSRSFTVDQALVNQSTIVDITDKFNFTGIYPLTFQRYYEDGNNGSGYPTGSEYYVYVTKDSVFHSEVPRTSECFLKLDSLNVISTHPNSLYYGLDLKSPSNNTYRLSIQSSKPIYCNTQDGVEMTDLPITAAEVTFYDPISNAKLNSFSSSVIENNTTLRFGGSINNYLDSLTDGKKLNFDLNFSMGGTNILVSKQNFPTLFAKDYTVYVESRLQLGLSQAGASVNLSDTPITISVKKNLGTSTNLNLASKSNPVTLDSSNFSNFFFDHNLTSIFYPTTNTTSLEDSLSYQICFSFKVLNIDFNSNYVSASINNLNPRCIDVKYRNSNPSSYTLTPQKIVVNLAKTIIASANNFEFNGNVYSNNQLPNNFMFKNNTKKFEGNYITSGSFTSNLKFLNNAFFGMVRPNSLTTSLVNFENIVDFSTSSVFKKFNLLTVNTGVEESNPINSSSFKTLNPISPTTNDLEIIAVSKGAGILIDLTNENIAKSFDKYIIINMDENRDSRVTFKIDCSDDRYSSICLFDNKFNFKGSLLGPFTLNGNIDSSLTDTKFIRIHENADTLIKLTSYLKSKKYQMVTSSLVNLKYD